MPHSLPVLELPGPEADRATRTAFRTELRTAAERTGFFQLTGHGIDPGQTAELLRLTREFFRLPAAARDAVSNLRSPHFRGYTRVGHELTGGRADRREQLDVALERAADPPRPGEPGYRWLHGPNLWPAELPGLRPAVLGWLDALIPIAHRLLGELLLALDAPAGFFDTAFTPDPHVHLKLIRYPGRPDGVPADQGVGAHKDYGFLTLLLQDEIGGLQVLGPDRNWLDVPVLPGAFVVNLGELLELATRGRLTATSHRVLSPPTGTERFSIGTFYNPRLDYRVELLPGENAPGVAADPANPLFDVYGENALKGWLRAHPEVARRHHPELL
jgi:isopenicillin N synthase-like dioxygenase